MQTAKIFMNGRSQAVRLPKEYRFNDEEVVISKLDDMVILFPKRKGWDLMAKAIDGFTEDFMADREQPKKQQRRKGL